MDDLQKLEAYIQDLEAQLAAITAQLATAQAQAKAWEVWGEQQHQALYVLNDGVECYCVETSKICRGCEGSINAISTQKPPTVTADSLARIARVARYVIQERECYKAETEGKCYEEWKLVASKRVDAVRALTPEAIALIDVLK